MAEVLPPVSIQSRQPSRKGKKAWRRNVDISQIESGLDSVRKELLQGGIVSEKQDGELYALDTTGSEAIKQAYQKKQKTLYADRILANADSTSVALDTRKRKTLDELAPPSLKQTRDGKYVSRKEVQRLKDVAHGVTEESHAIISHGDAAHDPWAAVPAVSEDLDEPSFIEKKKPVRAPSTLQHAPISLAASGRPFAAVRRPGAGTSYNPLFEEWQDRIAREGVKEVSVEQKRLQEEANYNAKMEKALEEAARPEPLVDESEYESAWESEWEGIQSENEDAARLKKKRPERKTPAERNKINRRKVAERQAKWDLQMKKREEQLQRIKSIAKEVRKADADRASRVQAVITTRPIDDSDDSDNAALKRRRSGKAKVPEAPLEVVLAGELQDSLRALRPEGNLFKDRFRNMIVNGKVESRNAIFQPKKAKKHVSEKWSYTDWKLR